MIAKLAVILLLALSLFSCEKEGFSVDKAKLIHEAVYSDGEKIEEKVKFSSILSSDGKYELTLTDPSNSISFTSSLSKEGELGDEDDENNPDHHHHHEDHDHEDHEHEDHEHHHEDEHEHHHDHHHHHEHRHEGESEDEYGIGTFIYYRRTPFNREKLRAYVPSWPKNIIRCKGTLWFSDEDDMAYVLETSGRQLLCGAYGRWVATASDKERKELLEENPQIAADWDEKVGDRMVRLCIIGRNLDKKAIASELDALLDK